MNNDKRNRPGFTEWLARPQTLVALSALLLSVCGLFIAIYEASIIRQAQRASVWPHVELTTSITDERIRLLVQNTGIGPARILAAAVTYKGETKASWPELLRSVAGTDADSVSLYMSMLNGRVLPANSAEETIFSVQASDAVAERVMKRLWGAIVEREVDVVVCYSSVYDACWTRSMQDAMDRMRGVDPPAAFGEVEDCESAQRSRI